MKTYRAGEEIDAKCLPACGKDLVLAHTVVAMVGDRVARVKCNTCTKEHSFQPPPSASEATANKRKAAKKAKKSAQAATELAALDYDRLLKTVDLTSAKKYSPKSQLDVREVVEHATFGLGVVTEVRDGAKATIVFSEGSRTLIFGRV
jgi:hypothetical protein